MRARTSLALIMRSASPQRNATLSFKPTSPRHRSTLDFSFTTADGTIVTAFATAAFGINPSGVIVGQVHVGHGRSAARLRRVSARQRLKRMGRQMPAMTSRTNTALNLARDSDRVNRGNLAIRLGDLYPVVPAHPMASPPDVTALLGDWSRGNRSALNELLPIVYSELRRIASRQLKRERVGHTLQPTALVHEVYLRLVDQRQVDWRNRAHFFGAAAEVMRRILVDHARRHSAGKRGRRNARRCD